MQCLRQPYRGTAASGCEPLPTPTEAESRIFAVALRPTDFPNGWRGSGVTVDPIDGADSRIYGFKGPPGTDRYSAIASQEIIVYPDSDTARDAYSGVEAGWFPTAVRVAPSQLRYKSATADQFRFGCKSVKVNQMPLTSVGFVQIVAQTPNSAKKGHF